MDDELVKVTINHVRDRHQFYLDTRPADPKPTDSDIVRGVKLNRFAIWTNDMNSLAIWADWELRYRLVERKYSEALTTGVKAKISAAEANMAHLLITGYNSDHSTDFPTNTSYQQVIGLYKETSAKGRPQFHLPGSDEQLVRTMLRVAILFAILIPPIYLFYLRNKQTRKTEQPS